MKSKNVKKGFISAKGFICATTFHWHLEEDPSVQGVYPSLELLRKEQPCVEECGAYEVEIKIKKAVLKGKF